MPLDLPDFRTFTASPREPSPDAIGGWDAEASRDYMTHCLSGAVSDFIELYGRQALVIELAEIGRTVGFECSLI